MSHNEPTHPCLFDCVTWPMRTHPSLYKTKQKIPVLVPALIFVLKKQYEVLHWVKTSGKWLKNQVLFTDRAKRLASLLHRKVHEDPSFFISVHPDEDSKHDAYPYHGRHCLKPCLEFWKEVFIFLIGMRILPWELYNLLTVRKSASAFSTSEHPLLQLLIPDRTARSKQFGDVDHADDRISQTGTSSWTGDIYQVETSNIRRVV